jgi:uncharacterized membrane protein
MLSVGLEQIFHTKRNVDVIVHLGYPLYFLYILGIWKILGAIVILIQKFSLLKEWAYTGFFFAMSGATFEMKKKISGKAYEV